MITIDLGMLAAVSFANMMLLPMVPNSSGSIAQFQTWRQQLCVCVCGGGVMCGPRRACAAQAALLFIQKHNRRSNVTPARTFATTRSMSGAYVELGPAEAQRGQPFFT